MKKYKKKILKIKDKYSKMKYFVIQNVNNLKINKDYFISTDLTSFKFNSEETFSMKFYYPD